MFQSRTPDNNNDLITTNNSCVYNSPREQSVPRQRNPLEASGKTHDKLNAHQRDHQRSTIALPPLWLQLQVRIQVRTHVHIPRRNRRLQRRGRSQIHIPERRSARALHDVRNSVLDLSRKKVPSGGGCTIVVPLRCSSPCRFKTSLMTQERVPLYTLRRVEQSAISRMRAVTVHLPGRRWKRERNVVPHIHSPFHIHPHSLPRPLTLFRIPCS